MVNVDKDNVLIIFQNLLLNLAPCFAKQMVKNVDFSESKPITLLKMNPNWALIMFSELSFKIL